MNIRAVLLPRLLCAASAIAAGLLATSTLLMTFLLKPIRIAQP
jgi:hypothetical protein